MCLPSLLGRVSESKSSRVHDEKQANNGSGIAVAMVPEAPSGDRTAAAGATKKPSSESTQSNPAKKSSAPDSGKNDAKSALDQEKLGREAKAVDVKEAADSSKQVDSARTQTQLKEQTDIAKEENLKISVPDTTFVLPEFTRVMVTKLTRNVTSVSCSRFYKRESFKWAHLFVVLVLNQSGRVNGCLFCVCYERNRPLAVAVYENAQTMSSSIRVATIVVVVWRWTAAFAGFAA